MPITQTSETIERRVRSLLARAIHPNTLAAEADLCMDQAKKLAVQNSIDLALLAAQIQDGRMKPSDLKFEVTDIYAADRATLFNSIAHVFGCKMVHTQRRPDTGVEYIMLGFQTDLDAVWTLAPSLDRQLLAELNRMKGGIAFKKSFITGYVTRVRERLQAFYKEAVAETGGPGTELVLMNRRDEVDSYTRSKLGRLRPGRPRALSDQTGFEAGTQAGQRANINISADEAVPVG